jgi:hypothetical protein
MRRSGAIDRGLDTASRRLSALVLYARKIDERR